MAFSTAGGRPFEAQINLTPMIDVLLVLIIVFMVAVSAIQKKGLAAEMPQAGRHQTQVRTIVVQVGPQTDQQLPALRINNKSVTWGDLQSQLVNIFKQRAERVAFIQGEDNVDYQYIADAISITRNSGVERVGLLPNDVH